MTTGTKAIDDTIASVGNLRSSLAKGSSPQVRTIQATAKVKSVCLDWFNSARPILASTADRSLLEEVDARFKTVLECSDRATTRDRYRTLLKELKPILVKLRSSLVAPPLAPHWQLAPAPDFSKLIPDPRMQQILVRRWQETKACISAKASLAATIMMGGLLEALLLAKVNATPDKSKIFKAKAAPKDPTTSKPAQLKEWTLKDFIDVAYELGWIGSAAKELSIVIRDYRNYVHPQRELSHRVIIQPSDAEMFWGIFSTLAGQIVDAP